jgi:hypothetical protein
MAAKREAAVAGGTGTTRALGRKVGERVRQAGRAGG